MASVALVDRLVYLLKAYCVRMSKAQQRNVAMLCVALAMGSGSQLGSLALRLAVPGRRDSLIQRVRRQLRRAPRWDKAFAPIVRRLLAEWTGVEIPLVMDRTDLGHGCSILTVGVAYGGRVLPLAWKVMRFGGTGAEVQIALLEEAKSLLPDGAKVTFFGDAEFRAVALQAYCRSQGWHWHVGIKSDTRICLADDTCQALADVAIRRGGRVYLQNVRLTESQPFGPVNIIVDWSPEQLTPRYWATDLPADRRAWRRGRKRYWVEPGYRDLKSYGFDLEGSRLTDPASISTLVLVMAITTLWLIHVGAEVRTTSRRPLIDIPHKRDYSLFRLGRDFITRACDQGWSVPVAFSVRHPAPR